MSEAEKLRYFTVFKSRILFYFFCFRVASIFDARKASGDPPRKSKRKENASKKARIDDVMKRKKADIPNVVVPDVKLEFFI